VEGKKKEIEKLPETSVVPMRSEPTKKKGILRGVSQPNVVFIEGKWAKICGKKENPISYGSHSRN